MKIKRKELWDLDTTFAEFIYPRLLAFRKMKRTGVPAGFKTIKEWNATLDKMIIAFKRIVEVPASPRAMANKYRQYSNKKVVEGLTLFSEYFGCLWD